ncbi:sterol desaturase family protein [Fretibacter rubidus]|uniref:sterol desaturase family protein n=1 Tax=Fretibacter rubidus TaxID=570162 RepID=UPI00352ACCAC
MTETLLNNETYIRLGVFAGLLVVLLLAEAVWPRKNRVESRVARWRTNIALTVIDGIALRVFVPLAAVGTAAWAAKNGWGLFNVINLPALAAIIISVIILDMLIYWQHVATHKIPLLWRLHKVHHADRDIDVTTGVRFHPVEICLSMVYKMVCVLALGAPVAAVIIFELILNGCALFNHANLRLPKPVDRVLRLFIVTPDMHRVHHSTLPDETNSNYGFSLSLWDRLFGSYIDQPSAGHNAMKIGLSEYQDNNPHKFLWSLSLPFKR